MNLKVKIAIGLVIVAAVIALIVIDQTSGTKPDPTKKDGAKEERSLFPAAADASRKESLARAEGRSELTEMRFRLPANERAKKEAPKRGETIRTGKGEAPLKTVPSIKGAEKAAKPTGENRIKAVEPVGTEKREEYVIQPGDTLSDIAARKFGSQTLWKRIVEANPGLRPEALRVGQKIKLPAKPAPRSDEPVVPKLDSDRVYVVQPGDTLGDIAKKLFKSSRLAEKIFQANRGALQSPNELRVGMKLRIPDHRPEETAPVRAETAKEDTVGGRFYQVKTRDALWKIAEKYRGKRGILEMVDAIVTANPGKLKRATDTLRVGWKLVIPQ